jgi:CHASE2 domain-containing sensor protein
MMMKEVSRMSDLLLAAFRRVRGAHCLLPTAYCLLLSAFCLLLTAYCLLPTVLNAQGCAMCYTSATAARAGAKEALANGVLILLVPPMVFFALITVVVYMYRNKFRETADWRPEHDRELQELLTDLAPAKGFKRSEDRVIG